MGLCLLNFVACVVFNCTVNGMLAMGLAAAWSSFQALLFYKHEQEHGFVLFWRTRDYMAIHHELLLLLLCFVIFLLDQTFVFLAVSLMFLLRPLLTTYFFKIQYEDWALGSQMQQVLPMRLQDPTNACAKVSPVRVSPADRARVRALLIDPRFNSSSLVDPVQVMAKELGMTPETVKHTIVNYDLQLTGNFAAACEQVFLHFGSKKMYFEMCIYLPDR